MCNLNEQIKANETAKMYNYVYSTHVHTHTRTYTHSYIYKHVTSCFFSLLDYRVSARKYNIYKIRYLQLLEIKKIHFKVYESSLNYYWIPLCYHTSIKKILHFTEAPKILLNSRRCTINITLTVRPYITYYIL